MVIEMVKTLSGPLSQQQNPNRLEPTRKPQLDLLEREEVKTKRPTMWNIVLYNDDYTSMEFVVFVLTKVFHRSTEDALAKAHPAVPGRSICSMRVPCAGDQRRAGGDIGWLGRDR